MYFNCSCEKVADENGEVYIVNRSQANFPVFPIRKYQDRNQFKKESVVSSGMRREGGRQWKRKKIRKREMDIEDF